MVYHFSFLSPGTRICMFLGFSLFLCTPGTCRCVFPGLVFYFIHFLFFPCTRNMAYHVSGAFFCLFSFFAPPGHTFACFGGLFILFLSLHPGTCVICMFAGVFLFFFIFCSSLHTSNLFQPADTSYKPPDTCFKPPAACFGHLRPQPTCFNHPRPLATHSLAPQAPKRMCEQSYVHFFFCLFFFGFGNVCTSSHTCVSDVFIYFILFSST
jgi:hypothetical protein